jgi:hypothetical protein
VHHTVPKERSRITLLACAHNRFEFRLTDPNSPPPAPRLGRLDRATVCARPVAGDMRKSQRAVVSLVAVRSAVRAHGPARI